MIHSCETCETAARQPRDSRETAARQPRDRRESVSVSRIHSRETARDSRETARDSRETARDSRETRETACARPAKQARDTAKQARDSCETYVNPCNELVRLRSDGGCNPFRTFQQCAYIQPKVEPLRFTRQLYSACTMYGARST